MHFFMPNVELLSITPNAECHIEYCTRTCYDSRDKITDNSYIKFLVNALKRGHFSILSHAWATIEITSYSRVATHQHVRHAHLRYCQKSQRYCNEENAAFVIPASMRNDKEAIERINKDVTVAQDLYNWLMDRGYKQEDARYFLVNATESAIVTTSNLQGWWDFLRLRLDKHAQLEIRQTAQQIYTILNKECPNIFNAEMLVVQPKLNLDFPDDI